MNKKHIFPILITIVALLALGFIVNTITTNTVPASVVDTTIATSSVATENNTPLTLAKLQSRPEWNPTIENEYMVRIEDGVTELGDEELLTKGRPFSRQIESRVFRYAPIFYDPEATYPPSKYNEFMILSADTGEVLHKYRLKEGYSMASRNTLLHNEVDVIVRLSDGCRINKNTHCIKGTLNSYDPATDSFLDTDMQTGELYPGHPAIHYAMDLLTGEIILQNPE